MPAVACGQWRPLLKCKKMAKNTPDFVRASNRREAVARMIAKDPILKEIIRLRDQERLKFIDIGKLMFPNLSPQKAKEKEQRARVEKAAALEELAQSRFSVLVGAAGTGKTTLLNMLCEHPEIKNTKVLRLAPTGKSRPSIKIRRSCIRASC